MIRGLKVRAPKKAATGFGGGCTYLHGITEWEGSETPVFVFVKEEDEAKIENRIFTDPVTVDAARHDFVVGHGLSLFDAELR